MRYLLIPLVVLITACQPQTPDTKTMTKTIEYGGWPSPISAASIVEGSRGLSTLAYDNGYVYWVESRPEEGGRNTIMRWKEGSAAQEVLAAPWNARTRVQEYGGRSVLVHNNTIWFTNFADQRLYRMPIGEAPKAITPEDKIRFGACELDALRDRLICIREDHRALKEPKNTLVSVPANGMSEGEVLFEGSSFVSAPGLSPDGKSVAFISWNHPNMPWDNTTLWSAAFDADGKLSQLTEHNANTQESVIDPQWDAQGNLYAISDRNNWWSLYQVNDAEFTLVASQPENSELGGPAWTIGKHYYHIRDDGSILAEITQGAVSQLYLLNPATQQAQSITPDSAAIGDFIDSDSGLFIVQDPKTRPAELVAVTDISSNKTNVVRKTKDNSLDPAWIPATREVSFPVNDNATAYGTYYPPTNPDVSAPEGSAPPLIVMIHGGPTGSSSPTYAVSKYYWTSRGFAILDVNYRGSTGYGRDYRKALYGEWGIADVQDAIAGAKWLGEQQLADREKLIIRGGSAGGYTTLAALATSHVFKAGASYYGISDIEALAGDTHKFESRYLDQLIGPYPERKDLYIDRSPIHHLDGFNAPLLLLQGLDDKVVPPNQSQMIFDALKAKGIPTAYIPFEGEGHGFRKSENIITALNAELYFYSQVLGLPLTEDLPAIEIVGKTQ
ncbi:prolyl oligopeptidase family serine peptidase [Neptunicella sp.]|uniref:alpha/beta hydrolase family protein n=1 Tax=Neptunicella sp. TaxID=2125986 RepID=UPI003F69193B